MARLRLRGDRLRLARETVNLSREDVAQALGLSSAARVRLWETGLETPRPRLVPKLAKVLTVDPLHLLDADPEDPPLVALRIAAGKATTDMVAPGMSVMTYVRLEDGRSTIDPPGEVIEQLGTLLSAPPTLVRAAIKRSRRDNEAAVLSLIHI